MDYDIVGRNYAQLRKADPRIAQVIESALGSSRSILNVGAGTGSYEPTGRHIIAIEPSGEMIAKRPPGAARAIQASAESLPFDDNSFEASMAILTIHHWRDQEAGLREMRRVTRDRIVVMTFDPSHRPWLTDYFPALAARDESDMPRMSDFERWLGPVQITPVLIPHDCSDGFLYAYWRRPRAYLDPHIRSGSSAFWSLGAEVTSGLRELSRDLETGEWERRYGALLALNECDVGYRLVVAERG